MFGILEVVIFMLNVTSKSLDCFCRSALLSQIPHYRGMSFRPGEKNIEIPVPDLPCGLGKVLGKLLLGLSKLKGLIR